MPIGVLSSYGFLFSKYPQALKTSLSIPLSYKIRLNQVRPANKINPYNQFF